MPPRKKLRRTIRAMAIVAIGLLCAGLLLFIVSVAVGGYDWTMGSLRATFSSDDEESLRDRVKRSALARWWRCRSVSRPLLTRTTGEAGWSLQYSWTNGFGRGDVYLNVRSTGEARVELHEHGEQTPRIQEVLVPDEDLARIAETIDDTGLLCLTPLKREDHHVVDLGRYTVHVESGEYAKEVFAGQCFYVADANAFNETLDAIFSLDPLFDERFSWGAYGITTLPEPCENPPE